jgi:urease accessory protein
MGTPVDPKTTSLPRRRQSTSRGADHGDHRMDRSPRADGAVPRGRGKAASAATLARLMTWLSPAYPVGGFSYSHALEWVVETGKVRDPLTLGGWIEDVLRLGAGRMDAIFLAEAWRAVAGGNGKVLLEVADLAAAFAPSAERHLETMAQGTAFLAATQAVWPALGACAAAHALPLAATAQAFVQAFAASLVSAGVRLIPLGQTDGLRVIGRLEPLIPAIVARALAASLDDVGSAAIAADVASMRHETQCTRLFRS